jgi:tRNA A37 methylthiotransferase MiaB
MNIFLLNKHHTCYLSNSELNFLRFCAEKLKGLEYVEQPELADLIVYSGCSVSDDYIMRNNKELDKLIALYPEKKFMLFGCAAPYGEHSNVISIVHLEHSKLDDLFNLPSGSIKQLHSYYFTYEKIFEDQKAIFISSGCASNCTYCNIKLSRPKLKSMPLEDILERVNQFYATNHHYVLCSDDCGSYGLDIGTNFAVLLETLVLNFPDILINIKWVNPQWFIKYYDVIKKYVDTGNVIGIECPIQSGSDRILKLMNRPYTVEEAIDKWTKIKGKLLSSKGTVIVNFPGETWEEFLASMSLRKHYEIFIVYIFKLNKNTASANLPDRRTEEDAKRRLEYLKEHYPDIYYGGDLIDNNLDRCIDKPYMVDNLEYD